jgi:hypothetical protein
VCGMSVTADSPFRSEHDGHPYFLQCVMSEEVSGGPVAICQTVDQHVG